MPNIEKLLNYPSPPAPPMPYDVQVMKNNGKKCAPTSTTPNSTTPSSWTSPHRGAECPPLPYPSFTGAPTTSPPHGSRASGSTSRAWPVSLAPTSTGESERSGARHPPSPQLLLPLRISSSVREGWSPPPPPPPSPLKEDWSAPTPSFFPRRLPPSYIPPPSPSSPLPLAHHLFLLLPRHYLLPRRLTSSTNPTATPLSLPHQKQGLLDRGRGTRHGRHRAGSRGCGEGERWRQAACAVRQGAARGLREPGEERRACPPPASQRLSPHKRSLLMPPLLSAS